jgi:hypothetical protein
MRRFVNELLNGPAAPMAGVSGGLDKCLALVKEALA